MYFLTELLPANPKNLSARLSSMGNALWFRKCQNFAPHTCQLLLP